MTEHIPVVGPRVLELSRRLRQSVVSFAQPGQLFEDLGITYIGVMPGHDLRLLEETFRRALALPGPVIVHVRTQKGKGYRPAETDQVSFHGAALPPMAVPAGGRRARPASGRAALMNGDPMASTAAAGSQVTAGRKADEGAPPSASVMADRRAPAHNSEGTAQPPAERAASAVVKTPNYTAFFAQELVALGATDRRIVAITAGMPTGTGLAKFQAQYPDRFIDVGIAEQHAVTLATGLALGGMRPVVALYSTFLQRAFDQTVHDVCQNDAPVLLAVDRAGLVGRGRHQPPGHVHRARPADAAEPRRRQPARRAGAALAAPDRARPGPPVRAALPARRRASASPSGSPRSLPVGRGEVLREGRDLLFVTFGPITGRALEVADALEARGWSVGVINARFVKPLDRQLILDQARGKSLVVTFEESVVTGGFGSAVLEAFEEARLADPVVPRDPGAADRDPGRPVRRPRVRHRPAAADPPRRPGPDRPGRRDARPARARGPGGQARLTSAGRTATPRPCTRDAPRVRPRMPR